MMFEVDCSSIDAFVDSMYLAYAVVLKVMIALQKAAKIVAVFAANNFDNIVVVDNSFVAVVVTDVVAIVAYLTEHSIEFDFGFAVEHPINSLGNLMVNSIEIDLTFVD